MNGFDVIVVGGGHAGVEAAAAAARAGAETALITQKLSTIGVMSCNPAIGGIGKGQLVREIDALDGIMGRAADLSAIQFRTLNRSKGPAVQGPRVQADRSLYKEAVSRLLNSTPNLSLIEDECEGLRVEGRKLVGFSMASGSRFGCKAAVLTTGTFLNGSIFIGEKKAPGGRIGERPVTTLSRQFNELGFQIGRLKTGTPPRLVGSSINFSALEAQWGDEDPHYFSSLTHFAVAPQVCCYVTRTNQLTHEIIENNLHKTAVYSGLVSGVGPRYCPSIEDKVVRFTDRNSHQIFLEPEGLDSEEIYPNGLSTSLPQEVQCEIIRSIYGLEKAKIKQFGYAVEYDFLSPTQLQPSLMSNLLEGLFFAGQVNGTTGYEEAAAQGIVAGVNAALHAGNRSAQIFDRADAYLGVLIDDLVTRGVSEPYRMFTSRAEFRLRLRADNADERLTAIGVHLGIVGADRQRVFQNKAEKLSKIRARLSSLTATSKELTSVGIDALDSTGAKRSAFEWATRSAVRLRDLGKYWPEINSFDKNALERVDADAKYSVYTVRQEIDVNRHKMDENLVVPREMDFASISGLSNEMKQKLSKVRPATIGQAGRIEGVTPAALMLLAVHARRLSNFNKEDKPSNSFT